MDLLISSAKPRVRRALHCGIGLLCGCAMLDLAFYGFRLVVRNYNFGNTSAAMQMPMYIAYLPIPFFALIMALRFYRIAWSALRGRLQAPKADCGGQLS